MTDYTPRLIAAGLRRGYRAAHETGADLSGPFCFDCRTPMGSDWSCRCWAPPVEATNTEPDLGAVQARIEAAGGLVLDLDEWARTSCPSLAAELDAARNTNSPADL